MADAADWTEADLLALIANRVQESLQLEYKKSTSLVNEKQKRGELSKDVSAFANSAGGVIVYGMAEDKNFPTQIDGGYDPAEISKEWIEQIINSTIQPRIDGIQINQISLTSTNPGRVAYAIVIPPATSRAPHQSYSKIYYKRFNFQVLPMEDYEIRDVARRATVPDLWLSFRFARGKSAAIDFKLGNRSSPIPLRCSIGNHSPQPAKYAVIDVLIDHNFEIQGSMPAGMTDAGTTVTSLGFAMRRFRFQWGAANHLPIFSEAVLDLPEPPLYLIISANAAQNVKTFYLGYKLMAPGFAAEKVFEVANNGQTITILG